MSASSSMRLIAIPLARGRPGAPPVCTFLAQTPKSTAKHTPAASSPSSSTSSPLTNTSPPSSSSSAQSTNPQPRLTTRLINKASDFWVGLGRDGQDGKRLSIFQWKRRTYNLGERLMDRIEYDEWALKAVDPAMGPKLAEKVQETADAVESKINGSDSGKRPDGKPPPSPSPTAIIPILYPSNLVSPTHLLHHLTSLTSQRGPHHRSRIWWCIAGMPLTIPFALLPIIPNLPFFYLAWRAYSHWRASLASEYLAGLLKERRVLPQADDRLARIFSMPLPEPPQSEDEVAKKTSAVPTLPADSAWRQGSPGSSSTDASAGSAGSAATVSSSAAPSSAAPALLLQQSHIDLLAKELHLSQQAQIDLVRARSQTVESIKKGEVDKIMKAAEGIRDDDGEERRATAERR